MNCKPITTTKAILVASTEAAAAAAIATNILRTKTIQTYINRHIEKWNEEKKMSLSAWLIAIKKLKTHDSGEYY